jgi:sugar phosphate isomerase/epimerase
MSATTQDVEYAIEHTEPEDLTPVRLDAAGLRSTEPEYLRDLKGALTDEGLIPAGLSVHARFEEESSFSTRNEIDRVRDHIRAAAFLGAGRVAVHVGTVADPETVRPALDACVEYARREGVRLTVEGFDVDA